MIEKLVDALDERNEHMEALVTTADRVNEQVKLLRHEVFRRPTRHEISHRRRVAAGSILLLSFVLMMVSDFNVNQCSPGKKAGIVVDELAKGHVLTQRGFNRLVSRRISPACDVAYPLHVHDGRDTWPTNRNTLGLVLYLAVAGGFLIYARGPRGWQPLDTVEEEHDHSHSG